MVEFVEKRIEPIIDPAPAPIAPGEDVSSDDDFGPNFDSIDGLPIDNSLVGGRTVPERALGAIAKYESHHKGYVKFLSFLT